jgi:hypothetical protein
VVGELEARVLVSCGCSGKKFAYVRKATFGSGVRLNFCSGKGGRVDLTVHHDPDYTTFFFTVSWLMGGGVDCEY